jgi:Flp pilus assembly protein TadG
VISRLRRAKRGQSAVEFALVLPVLMLVVLGIVDFGRVFIAANALTHGTREAVRFSTVNGAVSTANLAAIRNQVITEATRSGTTVTASQVSIDYFDTTDSGCTTSPYCSVGTADNGANYTAAGTCPRSDCGAPLVGDLVQVRVSVPWTAATVMINRLLPSGFAITANSAGTIE